jgi:DNA-binding IclR family transcriptional regulator
MRTDDTGPRAGGRVQSLDRAIALLNAVSAGSPEGRSAAELAAGCSLNRATAWRLLTTLEHHGLVERDPVTNRYSVGFAVTRLAATAGVVGLVRRAHDVLERLSEKTGETASLAVERRHGLTYVDEVVPPAVLAARWLGRQIPIHATSAGKALLAWLPQAEVDDLLSSPLPGSTATSHTDRQQLREELAEIRERGYSVSFGETEEQLNGVAAPVLDAARRAYAVVSLWGPRDRMPAARVPELGDLVTGGAAEIAELMAG